MQRAWRRNWVKNKNGQPLLKRVIGPLVGTSLIVGMMTIAYANPTGGVVTAGTGSISQDGQVVTVKQTTDKLAINWDSFSIGVGEKVNFIQPSYSSIALNRVIGSEASNIYGTLTARGRVFLINPNGILFAPGASVNVSGLVASTSNISDQDFMDEKHPLDSVDERYPFAGGEGGSVINQGNITAERGNVELLGSVVGNSGIITATKLSFQFDEETIEEGGVVRLTGNSVTLESGSKITADTSVALRSGADGNGGGSVTIAPGTVKAPVTNIYYNPISYDDAATKSDAGSNPYASILTDTIVYSYMLVNQASDLEKINTNLGGYYGLNSDLNMADINFVPIGNGRIFSGKFDGNNYTISNLAINSAANDIGLFGVIDRASIRNLTLDNVKVTGTASGVDTTAGALAGRASYSSIDNVDVSGQVISAANHVGGIVGRNSRGWFTTVSINGEVTGTQSSSNVGGIVGFGSNSTINNWHEFFLNTGGLFSVVVTGQSSSNIGGVVGLANDSDIRGVVMGKDSVVTGQSSSSIGGIVGASNSSKISHVANSGTVGIVSGDGKQLLNSNIGGLAGSVDSVTKIEYSGNSGNINGGYGLSIGGLVGAGSAKLDWSDNSGSVIGWADNSYVGGLVGRGGGFLTEVKNTGSVTNYGHYGYAGGIFGLAGYYTDYSGLTRNSGTISALGGGANVGGIAGAMTNVNIYADPLERHPPEIYNTGNVIGGINCNIGGVVGYLENSSIINFFGNYGVVRDTSYEIQTNNNIGGIVGKSVGSGIIGSYNIGQVISYNTSSNIGGIVGLGSKTVIYDSTNSGSITGPASSNVGGIVGLGYKTVIYDSTNSGNITGQIFSNIGGLVGCGLDESQVNNSRNSGIIGVESGDGRQLASSNIGGIIGYNKDSAIKDAVNTGAVSGGSGWHIGGIAGNNLYGTISNSRNSGVVTGWADNSYVGGVAGSNNQSTITKSSNSGAVTNSGNNSHAGGIAGTNWQNAVIDQSFNKGAVSAPAVVANTGGIAGGNGAGSTISNSYNTGTIGGGSSLYSSTGGLVGWYRDGTIVNSYNSSLVSGGSQSRMGALVGKVGSSSNIVQSLEADITNSCFDLALSGDLRAFGNVIDAPGVIGLAHTAMSDLNNFSGWDFNSVWKIDSITGLPGLKI